MESSDRALICTHATFRFAVDQLGAEIVATFRLFDISRRALERLLHRLCAPPPETCDPGPLRHPVKPREWLLCAAPGYPAIEKIQERSLHRYEHRPDKAALVWHVYEVQT